MPTLTPPAGGWGSLPIDGSDFTVASIKQLLSTSQGQQIVYNRLATAIQAGLTTKDNIGQAPRWLQVLIQSSPQLSAALEAGPGNAATKALTGTSTDTETGTPTSTDTGTQTGTGTTSTVIPPVTSDIGGKPIGSSAILPGVIPPINPQLQGAWNNFLTQNVGKGLTPYPGMLTPMPNQNLLSAWGGFQPNINQAPGMNWLQDQGMKGVQNMLMYGTPSTAGTPLAMLAQGMLGSFNGFSSPAQYLTPFLTQGASPLYRAPMIPIRNVQMGR